MFIPHRFFAASIGAVAFGAALLVPSAAFADVKVVSLITVKGQPKFAQPAGASTDKPIKTTAYYKGDKSRTETDAGATIVDLGNGKVYTLDPAKKTFSVTNLQDMEKAASTDPFLSNAKVASTTTIATGTETKQLLGKTTKSYDYTSTFTITIEGNDALNAFMPKMSIQGKMWNDESLILPGDPQKMAQTTYMLMLPAQIRQGIKAMTDKLSTMKGFPLLSVVTFTVTPPPDAPDFVKEQIPKEPIVTTTEVQSISQDALSDSLFTVPADYKEVKIKNAGLTVPTAP